MLSIIFAALLIWSNISETADIQGQCSVANQVNFYLAQKLMVKIFQDKEQHNQNQILDIDCRTGEITAEIARLIPKAKVIGIISNDENHAVIHHKTAMQKFDHLTNLSFNLGTITPGKQNGPAAQSSFLQARQPGSFSGIVNCSSLHWMYRLHMTTTLKNMHTALKVGGTCYLLLAGKRSDGVQDLFTQAVDAAMKQEPWHKKFEENDINGLDDTILAYTQEDFTEIAKETGFVPQEITVDAIEYTFPSVERYKEWLFAMSPREYQEILGEHHNGFINAVAQEYVKICPAELDGTLTYKNYMLYALLKKKQ